MPSLASPNSLEVPLPQAAQRLGVSWGVAYALVLQGRLKGRQVAGRWLVDAEGLLALARERETAQA